MTTTNYAGHTTAASVPHQDDAVLVRMAAHLNPNFHRLPAAVQAQMLTDMQELRAEVLGVPTSGPVELVEPVAPAAQWRPRPPELAYGYADLQELGNRLLAPRELVRDEDGHLFHPDIPVLDESVRIDSFLAAFGLETAFVGMEDDCPDDPRVDACFDAESGCGWWEPTEPAGEGWRLLEIYDTENGPFAMYARRRPAPVRLSRRQQRELQLREAEIDQLAKEAERQALAATREGWQVVPVRDATDTVALEEARASWAAFDAAQVPRAPDSALN